MLTRALVAGAAVLLVGCRSLPEPESPAARSYAAECGACHRAYLPSTMTWPMWQYQMGRMKELYAQKGRPWLTPREERLVNDYLKRYAEGQEPQS